MIFLNTNCAFPYLKIKNLYSERETYLIWKEIEFLSINNKLEPPQKTGQSDPNAKKNSGIFIDDVYTERKFSDILQINRKIFSKEITEKYKNLSFFGNYFLNINLDYTLLQYYENDEFYKSHMDQSVITTITWFFKEPKKFIGGDLLFPNYNELIKIENNLTVIFPSCIHHEVIPIKMEKRFTNMGLGRYSLSNFAHIKPG